MQRPKKISWLGLGNMGSPMAGHLAQAGFSLTVYDVNRKAQDDFAARYPCVAAQSLSQAAQGCQVLITMLPNGDLVRRAVLGENGGESLCESMPPGSVLVDMSSSSPVGTQQLGRDLASRGIEMLDAPVSGGVSRAVEGTLSILVGGRKEAVDYCRPVLEAMGASIFETGPLGSAHAMKSLNNMLSATGLLAAAEVLLVGKRFGLAPEVMVDVFNASTGQNNSTKNKFKQFVFSRSFASGFSLELMVKDLGLAMELARETKTPVVLSAASREMWTAALAALGDNPDHTEVVRWMEQAVHTELAS
ncbi:MAG: NAD(P)-dependent oxidoreductase [Desulfarculaceae bacterium]|nr:NAD(P)-dependent oxidoreductase [Desulfarculaceae bacterium]MCF8048434.1 NAD(P)-dependent oxidoreductase [Desulfarculaceae bacterium]MCF8097714.1 NAD(P)-dependent oxidoreductase [Desulfarculaceae bacterium]